MNDKPGNICYSTFRGQKQLHFTERALYHEEDVPVEKLEHRLEDQDLVCPKYSGKLIEIGKKAVNKLKIIPVQVVMGKYPKRLAKVCVVKSSDLSEKNGLI